MKINDAALKVPGVIRVQSNMAFDYEWKYLATSEGSYLEQEIWRTSPGFTVTALKDGKSKSRTFSVAPKSAGYEVVLDAKMLENVERIANEAVEHCTAPPVGVGLKDLIMTPAHAMLTIHEIVAHPDRARSRGRLRSQLRRHQLRQGERRRQADDGLEAVQRDLRPHARRRHVHRRLRRRRRQVAALADHPGRPARRPADQSRDRALHRADRVEGLHLRDLVAQLSVPAHAERPRRAGPAGIADARSRSSPTPRTAS